jgi:hypothetical protein
METEVSNYAKYGMLKIEDFQDEILGEENQKQESD